MDGLVFEYTGAWSNGNRDGLGTTSFPNGDVYSGNYKDDKRHGHGDMLWAPSGNYPVRRRYVGDYIKGQRHGHGQMTFPNGDVYTGDWKKGRRTGRGLYLFAQSGNRYKGEYVDGVKQGQGIFWWTSGQHAGDRYIGAFSGDKRNGRGTYTYANGDIYVGNWLDGKQHGDGEMLYAEDLSRLRGQWSNGLREGRFVLELESGELREAQFYQGQIQQPWRPLEE